MAFDLDDEELEATRKLFSTPTDEAVLKNIIAEYDARVEDSKTYSVTVPVSRKETIAMSNLLKKVKEQKEELSKYIVMLTDEQYRRLVNIIRDDVNKEWQSKIKAKIEEIQSRRIKDGGCELALHGFQREAKIQVLQDLLKN